MGICSRWPATIPFRNQLISSRQFSEQTTDHENELEVLLSAVR
jgi:hypothetical protein